MRWMKTSSRLDGICFHAYGARRNGATAGAGTPAKPGAAAASVAAANVQDILILADNTDASATRMAAEFASAIQSGGFR